MNHHILFIDDEEQVLDTLRRTFRKSEITASFETDGERALENLGQNSASVIIADMRMPGMDGLEFLGKVKEICPDAILIVLSGYADMDMIMKAVNEKEIWRYITKPWKTEELLLTISNAIELYENRVERKRLLEELELKNRQLDELNSYYENANTERQWIITELQNLYRMKFAGDSREWILKKACMNIEDHLTDVHIYIYDIDDKRMISVSPDAPTLELENAAITIQEHEEGYSSPRGEVLPGRFGVNIVFAMIIEYVNSENAKSENNKMRKTPFVVIEYVNLLAEILSR